MPDADDFFLCTSVNNAIIKFVIMNILKGVQMFMSNCINEKYVEPYVASLLETVNEDSSYKEKGIDVIKGGLQ